MICDFDESKMMYIGEENMKVRLVIHYLESDNKYILDLKVPKNITSEKFLYYILHERILKQNYFDINNAHWSILECAKEYNPCQTLRIIENRNNREFYRNLISGNCQFFKALNHLKIDNGNINVLFSPGGIGAMYDDFFGITFYTHANEENHKYSPHIHTRYNNKEATYSLVNFKKMVGEIYPSKIEKIIVNKLKTEKNILKQFWLDTTNGLWPEKFPSIDIEVLR